jgi:hypothetical protein
MSDTAAGLRPPLPIEHESFLCSLPGPVILIDGRTIETPHGEAGGHFEFVRAREIITSAGVAG